ncbi:MAG TPA: DUF2155 domain-containing protein [Phenylobacterium sp.]|jgi:hypothetical protein
MSAPSRVLRLITPVAAGAVLLGLACAGLSSAQPAPPPPTVAPTTPPPGPDASGLPPGAPPPEEAPPVMVAPPAPVSAPPVQAAEVAPAAPPAAHVAEKPAEAVKRARSNVAILQALDKVTAESIRFEAEVGKPVRYKSLIFTVKACERAAPDEAMDDSIAYLTIDSQPRPAPGKPVPPPRQAFRGWMYASSPGLNPLEHPVYDAWVITCKALAPALIPASAPRPAAKPRPAAPAAEPAPAPPPILSLPPPAPKT